jgi:hypothetical protein
MTLLIAFDLKVATRYGTVIATVLVNTATVALSLFFICTA